MKSYPVIGADGRLAPNDIWNVPPAPQNEVRGSLKTSGPWARPVSYRALAMDMHGRIFGLRAMLRVRDSGYDLAGWVKIEGRSYRAFTSSQVFGREDGSSCDVATIHVCDTPEYRWPDPIQRDAAYRAMLSSRYHFECGGTYADLRDYCRALDAIYDGSADKYPHCQYREKAERLRAKLAPLMGW